MKKKNHLKYPDNTHKKLKVLNRCWKPAEEKDRKKEKRQGKKKKWRGKENVTRITEREEQKKKRKVFYGAHGIDLWPFCSQQDGVVINWWSLRDWTPLGTHFKQHSTNLGLLAGWSRAEADACFTAAHLQGSTLAENETLCLLMFSSDIFINTLSTHPRTFVIILSFCLSVSLSFRTFTMVRP